MKIHDIFLKMNKSNTNFELPIITNITNNDNYSEIYKSSKEKAFNAIVNKKIFTIYGSGAIIRKVLLSLGWIEKCSETYLPDLQKLSEYELIKNIVPGNDYEIVFMSKIVKNYCTTLLWQNTKIQPEKLLKIKPKYQNRIQRSKLLNFTTKEGLIGCIENSYWTTIRYSYEIRTPRFHRLSAPEEKSEFIDDYQITYCLSLLKFINDEKNSTELFHEFGKISIDIIKTAIKKINYKLHPKQLNKNNYSNLNNQFLNKNKNKDWKNFYLSINLIINRDEKFRSNKLYEIRKCINKCQLLIHEANETWPNISTDGYNNLWILKPASRSQGYGIVIKNNLDDIFSHAYRHIEQRYIVQKYIERPLLIYNTKFDIRQYALITISNSKLRIWMYKDCCYLRFSSQEYQLSTLTESVHLTNNSVQKKYKNGSRSLKLPEHNMWSLDEFQNYLKNCGKNDNDIWKNIIYYNMKSNFIAVVLSSLIEIELKPNTFEFFGCDFMLDENYVPILIEINAVPDMSPSTIVTSKICPKVLEDVINVIVDFPITRQAKAGQFELIYCIEYTKINNNNKFTELKVDGIPISTIKQLKRINKKKQKFQNKNYSKNDKKKSLKPELNFKKIRIEKPHNRIKKLNEKCHINSNFTKSINLLENSLKSNIKRK